MTYYYPFQYVPVLQQVNYSLSASIASASVSPNILVRTASFAASVVTMPPDGAAGANKNIEDCPLSAPSGPKGPKGPAGTIAGVSLTECPAGSVECLNLKPPLGFSKVCIQIPAGCEVEDVVCPSSLTGTAPSAPPACYNLGTFIYAISNPVTPSSCISAQYTSGPTTLYSVCMELDQNCVIYSNELCTTSAVSGLGIHSFTSASNPQAYYVLNSQTSGISSISACDAE
jgi:hypothetical protein